MKLWARFESFIYLLTKKKKKALFSTYVVGEFGLESISILWTTSLANSLTI